MKRERKAEPEQGHEGGTRTGAAVAARQGSGERLGWHHFLGGRLCFGGVLRGLSDLAFGGALMVGVW